MGLKLKFNVWLDEFIIKYHVPFKSSVLLSDEWLTKNKINFRRKIGQQITRWSCFPSCLEVINYINDAYTKCDILRDKNFLWQKKNGETRWFMPYDKKSIKHILDSMNVVAIEILKADDITQKNVLNKWAELEANGVVLCFHRFSRPDIKPTNEVNHATVIYSISSDKNEKIKLIVPAYNKSYKANKQILFEYKNWREIKKRVPTYAVFIKIKKNDQETTKNSVLNKFKTWWL